MDLAATQDALLAAFRARGRTLVAFSGGVDSGLVARLARDALDGGALAVIADAESLARRELADAESLAAEIGIPLRVVPLSELANPAYAANPADRCYFCRSGLVDVLTGIATREGYGTVADGIHASDLGDVRPGVRAMDEAGVWHPLLEFGLTKADVRALARGLGLSVWDRPSNACLSSRVPSGTPITVEVLRQVEAAEDVLRGRGFHQVRVRHHGTTAKVEVGSHEVARLEAMRDEVAEALRALGYRETVVDPVGYRGTA